jgi:hypothetical protein
VFHEIVDAFTRVAALAHNWSFPIKFPSYLFLDSFLASVQYDPIVVDGSEGFQFTDNQAHGVISAPGGKTCAIAIAVPMEPNSPAGLHWRGMPLSKSVVSSAQQSEIEGPVLFD